MDSNYDAGMGGGFLPVEDEPKCDQARDQQDLDEEAAFRDAEEHYGGQYDDPDEYDDGPHVLYDVQHNAVNPQPTAQAHHQQPFNHDRQTCPTNHRAQLQQQEQSQQSIGSAGVKSTQEGTHTLSVPQVPDTKEHIFAKSLHQQPASQRGPHISAPLAPQRSGSPHTSTSHLSQLVKSCWVGTGPEQQAAHLRCRCGSPDITPEWHTAFGVLICNNCRRHEKLITKGNAKQLFGLTERDLSDLGFILKDNPQHKRFSAMKLYWEAQVQDIAESKPGGLAAVQEARQKRVAAKVEERLSKRRIVGGGTESGPGGEEQSPASKAQEKIRVRLVEESKAAGGGRAKRLAAAHVQAVSAAGEADVELI